jgi:bifunctional DNA-binding transcriptional regulator/antitoxin component of YhaV-PrlF toxin-antitoxin module
MTLTTASSVRSSVGPYDFPCSCCGEAFRALRSNASLDFGDEFSGSPQGGVTHKVGQQVPLDAHARSSGTGLLHAMDVAWDIAYKGDYQGLSAPVVDRGVETDWQGLFCESSRDGGINLMLVEQTRQSRGVDEHVVVTLLCERPSSRRQRKKETSMRDGPSVCQVIGAISCGHTRAGALGCVPCDSAATTMHYVALTTNARVSHRGQTSLPAELRHRWGIEEGGEIGFIDLGGAALVVPGGVKVARRELRRVLRDRYENAIAAIDDADLADQ